MAAALEKLATQLAEGHPLANALSARERLLPPELVGLTLALLRTGECHTLFATLGTQRARLQTLWRELRSVLAYPLVMLLATWVFTVAFANYFIPIMKDLDPGILEFPLSNFDRWIWFIEEGQYVLGLWLLLLGAGLLAARWLLPWEVWCRLRGAVPLVGVAYEWSGLAAFFQLLAVLVREQLPLDLAVKLAGDASPNGHVRAASLRVAQALQRGALPGAAFAGQSRAFPPVVASFVESGVASQQLATSLAALAELFGDRVEQRTRLLRSIAPPLLFLFILASSLSLPLSLYEPTVQGIQLLGAMGGGWGGSSGEEKTGALLLAWPLLLPLGALLIARRLMFRGAHGHGRGWLETTLLLLEWRLLVLLLLAICCGSLRRLGIPMACLAIIVLAVSAAHYYLAQQRSVLLQLAAAGEAQLPLVSALQAMATELPLGAQKRVLRVAKEVSQGATLSRAIRTAWFWLPYELRFPLTAAEATGAFGPALREALAAQGRAQQAASAVTRQTIYVYWILGALLSTLTFLLPKIVPVFENMFKEYAIDLPKMTQLLINLAQGFTGVAGLLLIPLLIVTALLAAMVDPLVARVVATFFPPFELVWMRLHGVVLLRSLSTMLSHGLTLPAALAVAAEHYPVSIVRRRLQRAEKGIIAGAVWTDVLRSFWLVGEHDAALLAAGERSRHLPWTLHEVAEGMQRRLGLRLRAISLGLFPWILVVLGGVIGFVVIALFMPLVALIMGLAK
jgi:type IV pilus assembly protein PilC